MAFLFSWACKLKSTVCADGSLLPMQFLSGKFRTEKMTSKVYHHAFMYVWKSQWSLLEVWNSIVTVNYFSWTWKILVLIKFQAFLPLDPQMIWILKSYFLFSKAITDFNNNLHTQYKMKIQYIYTVLTLSNISAFFQHRSIQNIYCIPVHVT